MSKKKYQFTYTKEEHCLPQHYMDILDKIDKDLQKVGILLHMTTLERITDSTFEYLNKKSKKLEVKK